MLSFLSFASNMCCNATSQKELLKEERKEEDETPRFEENFMIWAVNYLI